MVHARYRVKYKTSIKEIVNIETKAFLRLRKNRSCCYLYMPLKARKVISISITSPIYKVEVFSDNAPSMSSFALNYTTDPKTCILTSYQNITAVIRHGNK